MTTLSNWVQLGIAPAIFGAVENRGFNVGAEQLIQMPIVDEQTHVWAVFVVHPSWVEAKDTMFA